MKHLKLFENVNKDEVMRLLDIASDYNKDVYNLANQDWNNLSTLISKIMKYISPENRDEYLSALLYDKYNVVKEKMNNMKYLKLFENFLNESKLKYIEN